MQINVDFYIEKLLSFYNVSSLTDLANKLGIKQSSLSSWKTRNSISAIKKKCREIGIYQDIFGDLDQGKTNNFENMQGVVDNNKEQLIYFNEYVKLEKLASLGRGVEFLKHELEELKERLKNDI